MDGGSDRVVGEKKQELSTDGGVTLRRPRQDIAYLSARETRVTPVSLPGDGTRFAAFSFLEKHLGLPYENECGLHANCHLTVTQRTREATTTVYSAKSSFWVRCLC